MLKPIFLTITIFVVGFLHNSIKKKKKFDAIKKIELSYWALLLSIPSLFFIDKSKDHHLMIVAVPLSIILGLILESKDNKIIKEFVFIILLSICFGFIFKAKFGI